MSARIVMAGNGFGIDTGNFLTTCFSGINLLDFDEVDKLIYTIINLDITLVIIDSFAALNNGNDENSVEFVQPIISALRGVIENTNCSIVLIHHANKKGGYRGSSAIYAGVDTMVNVTRINNTMNFHFLKSRDFEPKDFSANVLFKEDLFQMNPTGYPLSVGQESAASLIRTCLEQSDYSLEELWVTLSDFSKGTIRNNLHELMRNGIVSRADDGGQGKKATYTFADTEKDSEEVCND